MLFYISLLSLGFLWRSTLGEEQLLMVFGGEREAIQSKKGQYGTLVVSWHQLILSQLPKLIASYV